MSDKEAAEKIRQLEKDNWDEESNHIEADQILCSLLKELGYAETVDAFQELNKWYA